jgi:hypothetical protein
MTGERSGVYEELVARLRSGGKVPLYAKPSLWRLGTAVVAGAAALVLEVLDALSDTYPWYTTAGAVTFVSLGLAEFIYAFGIARNAAIRLSASSLELWDWRGRPRPIRYTQIEAGRVRRVWRDWVVSVCLRGDEGEPTWRRLVAHARKLGRFPWLVASETAGRCALVERSEGFWGRSPVDEVREPVAWE